MKLICAKESDIDFVYSVCEKSFPSEEIRPYNQLKKTFSNEKYVQYLINENGENVGCLGVWVLDDYAFIENFAILKEFRNNGLGSSVITFLKTLYKKIILEVEFPVDELTKRRIGFYQRNGLILNDFEYFMPSYVGGRSIPLKIMTYPNLIDKNDIVIKNMYKFCYGIEKTIKPYYFN